MKNEYFSIIQPGGDRCFICAARGRLDTHHVFEGANRSASDKYGVVVKLCRACHTLSDAAVHNNTKANKDLKHLCQIITMRHYGWDLPKWFSHFTVSYLEENERKEFEK